MIIGHAIERNGLYYMEDPNKPINSHSLMSKSTIVELQDKVQPFYLVHTNVWGPANVPNIMSAKRFITFMGDYTQVKWEQTIDVKMEALNKNRTWELITLPTGKKPIGV